MPTCAFLTMDSLADFVCDDELAVAPLRRHGWHVDMVPWRTAADWGNWDMVIIRSPWDYQDAPGSFMETLEAIDRSGTRLENPLETVRWNLDKRYLLELSGRGAPVIPTLCFDRIGDADLGDCFASLDSDHIIVKPVVGANADHTYPLRPESLRALPPELAQTFRSRPFLVQPFRGHVLSEGEYSLFYFGGHYSHTILKTPREGDYRVQEEHGGIITAVPEEGPWRAVADAVIAAIGRTLLYARVDLVRNPDDGFELMELELIEPALYLRMNPDAPARFAEAVAGWPRR